MKKLLKKYITNQIKLCKPLTIAKVYKEEKTIIEYPLERKKSLQEKLSIMILWKFQIQKNLKY